MDSLWENGGISEHEETTVHVTSIFDTVALFLVKQGDDSSLPLRSTACFYNWNQNKLRGKPLETECSHLIENGFKITLKKPNHKILKDT